MHLSKDKKALILAQKKEKALAAGAGIGLGSESRKQLRLIQTLLQVILTKLDKML